MQTIIDDVVVQTFSSPSVRSVTFEEAGGQVLGVGYWNRSKRLWVLRVRKNPAVSVDTYAGATNDLDEAVAILKAAREA